MSEVNQAVCCQVPKRKQNLMKTRILLGFRRMARLQSVNVSTEVVHVKRFITCSPYHLMAQSAMRICMVLCLFLISACSSPAPIPPSVLAKEHARQTVDGLNARVIHAYQERQEAVVRLQNIQTKLRHPGLSSKERANYQIDFDEATIQLANASQQATELEEELRQEWAAYRAQYGSRPQLAGPSPR